MFEKIPVDGNEPIASTESSESVDVDATGAVSQQLKRNLRGKEVQLFAIGGAIGTGMFS